MATGFLQFFSQQHFHFFLGLAGLVWTDFALWPVRVSVVRHVGVAASGVSSLTDDGLGQRGFRMLGFFGAATEGL